MRIRQRSALFRYRSAQHWIEVFSTYFGPVMRTLEALDAAGRRAFLGELESLLQHFNHSADNTLMVSSDYLEVVMVTK